MEENSDSTSWVLVNDIDNAEETVTLISLSSSAESDEDSDGSIVILKDHTSDSDLEENAGQIKSLVTTPTDDSSKPSNLHSEDMRNQVEDISETQDESHQTDESDCNTDGVSYLEDQIELVTNQQLATNNGETSKDGAGIKISVGLLISLLAFMTSHLVREYSEYHINDITNSNEEYLVPDIPTYTLIDLCIYQKFSKGQYTEQAIEKCVNKKLRKLNIEEITEDSLAYLHMKKRIAELQDEFPTNPTMEEADKKTYKSDKKEKNLEKKKQKHNLKQPKREFNNKFSSTSKSQLKVIKEKVKFLLESEEFGKKFQKAVKNLDSNEEWYIKYNPVKDAIEILNTSSMPMEPSTLTKKNQNLLNGEWYFKLFGSSRADNRKKGEMKDEVSQWFFKRGRHRANKRNKAKWYFDYMSAREDTRYV